MTQEPPSEPPEPPRLRVVPETGDVGFRLGHDGAEPRDLRRFTLAQRRVIASDLRWRAYELKLGGATYRGIANVLKCSTRTAWRYVQEAMAERGKMSVESTESHRRMQLDRIESAVLALWPSVVRGDGEAIRNLVRLLSLQSLITGTRSPIRHSFELQLRQLAKESGLPFDEVFREIESIAADAFAR